jgi:hypothetical protein
MANGQLPMINVGGNLPPEILQQQQALNRQQQMAQLLMQQGQQQPQGQMVSGRYVAPSFFQYAAPLAQTFAGMRLAEKGDIQALEMAKQLRQQYADEMQNYLKIQRGTPAVEGGIYGPDNKLTMQTTPDMIGPQGEIIAPYKKVEATPAVAPNQFAANLYASTAYNPVLQQMASKKLLEGPQWKEISQFNPQTGNTENYRYDSSSSNPRETMQFLGVSKPAISPEAQIRFADEGIGIPPQFRGNVVNQNVTTPQGQPLGQPSGQPTVTSTAAPTVASTQQYDPFKAPPVPAGLTGRQAREWTADQAKPLTGESEKQVSGAINYQKSLTTLQDIFGKYQGADLLKPNVRAEIQQALNNALLQGKEANRLGVLNGPDLSILEKIVGDPTSFDALLKDRSTLNKLYDNQRMFTAEVIKTNYRSAQKAVPQNLREFVEVKPRELPDNKPKDDGGNLQNKLRALNIPYQPRIYDYRVNPDGSVDRKRKTQ